MNCIIYVRDNKDISVYEQFNELAAYTKRYGYSISGKVLDFEGNELHEAINKVIANESVQVLLIYSKENVFANNDDYLFYRIYLEKLGKILVCGN